MICLIKEIADHIIPKENGMKEFLEWLTTGKIGQCRLVNNLDDAIQKARKHEEWRLEYMTLLMRDQEMMKKGREEGLITGREEGRNIERLDSIRNMIKCEVPKEKILELYTEEEYTLAIKKDNRS